MIAENAEFLCIALQPAAERALPPDFGTGWFGMEGDNTGQEWRWSVEFYNHR